MGCHRLLDGQLSLASMHRPAVIQHYTRQRVPLSALYVTLASLFHHPDMLTFDVLSQDFCWSPSAPVMAVYQVESAGGNLPARISLLRMPDRAELRQKNLFSVADVQMFWHPQGDYLAVQVGYISCKHVYCVESHESKIHLGRRALHVTELSARLLPSSSRR